MLINSFFTVKNIPEINLEKSMEFLVDVKINSQHSIFNGHFPGQPIVPGVTYIEMIREIMELALKNKFRIKEISNIKFLSITNPVLNPELSFIFNLVKKDENVITAKVLITSDHSPVIKFDGNFSS